MKKKFGQVGDDRLILMAALMVTDELSELRRQVQELKTTLSRLAATDLLRMKRRSRPRPTAAAIGAAADRLEMLE